MKSIWAMFGLSFFKRVVKVCVVCRMFVLIESLSNWYRYTRFGGMRSTNDGWLRVSGFVAGRLDSGV